MFSAGEFYFGLVIGYITYRTLRRKDSAAISDIATVIGAVGGGAIVSLFPSDTISFDLYAKGLAFGFFTYLVIAMVLSFFPNNSTNEFLGD